MVDIAELLKDVRNLRESTATKTKSGLSHRVLETFISRLEDYAKQPSSMGMRLGWAESFADEASRHGVRAFRNARAIAAREADTGDLFSAYARTDLVDITTDIVLGSAIATRLALRRRSTTDAAKFIARMFEPIEELFNPTQALEAHGYAKDFIGDITSRYEVVTKIIGESEQWMANDRFLSLDAAVYSLHSLTDAGMELVADCETLRKKSRTRRVAQYGSQVLSSIEKIPAYAFIVRGMYLAAGHDARLSAARDRGREVVISGIDEYKVMHSFEQAQERDFFSGTRLHKVGLESAIRFTASAGMQAASATLQDMYTDLLPARERLPQQMFLDFGREALTQ